MKRFNAAIKKKITENGDIQSFFSAKNKANRLYMQEIKNNLKLASAFKPIQKGKQMCARENNFF